MIPTLLVRYWYLVVIAALVASLYGVRVHYVHEVDVVVAERDKARIELSDEKLKVASLNAGIVKANADADRARLENERKLADANTRLQRALRQSDENTRRAVQAAVAIPGTGPKVMNTWTHDFFSPLD